LKQIKVRGERLINLLENNMDKYQERYTDHQNKKKRQLMFSEGLTKFSKKSYPKELKYILDNRRSQRVFLNNPIEEKVMQKILNSAITSPSSCNRHGIHFKIIKDRKEKELLAGILVGGVGWIHKADTIILFLADPVAYKSPREKEFMHYCDVGFTAMSLWLTAESLGIGASYINPNMNYKEIMQEKFAGEFIFCGAMVFGNYERKAIKSKLPDLKDIIL